MNTQELYDECHRLFNYDAENGLLTRKVKGADKTNVGDVVGCMSRGYLTVGIQYKIYFVHRIIWLMQTGSFPKEHTDHINGIRNDNRWCNLREATNSENGRNRGKTKSNKTGFKRVDASGKIKNPYRARIRVNGEEIHLGHFPTPELAHEAYCEASKKLHGEFRRIA